jgi:sugar phosphate isomerase/epimerase
VGRYKYFLSIQTLLPDDYKNNADFTANMKRLQSLGFDGVELNIREPESINPDTLTAYLADFGLTLSVFATGFTAKTRGLSLASKDEARRKASVNAAKDFLAFAAQFGAGAVAGFLKGSPGENSEENRALLAASLAEIAPEALRLKTPFIVEAINRFESPLGNSLDEAWELIKDVKNPYMHILPDTWHMNIEESNMEAAIIRHNGHFAGFHLSDNNRFLPGFGALDFKKIIGVLDALGYTGKAALEANIKNSFCEDVAACMEYLGPLLKKD